MASLRLQLATFDEDRIEGFKSELSETFLLADFMMYFVGNFSAHLM
jgi:hypothetical protein